MARLINADALMKFLIRIDHYDKEHGSEDFVLGIETVLEYAEHLPAVDAVPVVHGCWHRVSKYDPEANVQCSKCLMTFDYIDGICYLVADAKLPHYCPNCGAKMDLED